MLDRIRKFFNQVINPQFDEPITMPPRYDVYQPMPSDFELDNADYTICHSWGNRIEFIGETVIGDKNRFARVSGHQYIIPKQGQTLLAEFQNSWILFEFTKVKPCRNPRDMFFADVKAIGQKPKSTPQKTVKPNL